MLTNPGSLFFLATCALFLSRLIVTLLGEGSMPRTIRRAWNRTEAAKAEAQADIL